MKLSERLRISLNRLEGGQKWIKMPAEKECVGGNCAWTTCEDRETARFLQKVLGFGDPVEVFDWNDAPERTWLEVEAQFLEAIARAEAIGQ